jgi:hypothetical protein
VIRGARTTSCRAAALAVSLLASAGAGVLAAVPASAAACTTTSWQGGTTGGAWTTAANWDNGVPDASTVASIPAQSAAITGVSGQACGLSFSGDVNLDGSLTLASSATVDVGTSTVTVTGGTWTLPDGASLLADIGTPGTVLVANGATVALAGGVVSTEAVVHLAEGATLTSTAPATLKQSAAGEFDWFGGTVSGDMTLNVLSIADGAVTRSVPTGSTVTVKNALEVKAGTLAVDGTLRNSGILRLYDGVAVNSPGGGGVLETGTDPLFPSTLYIGTDSIFDSGTVTMTGISLRTDDQLSIDAGMRLVLTGSVSTPSRSTLGNGTVLTAPQPAAAGQAPPTFVVSQGAQLTVQGKTTFQKGVVLSLADGADGTAAGITGTADGVVPATLTASAATNGTFAWGSGTVTGPLALSGINTSVTAGGGQDRRILDVAANSTSPALSLGSDSTFTSGGLQLRSAATVAVTGGTTQLLGTGTFFSPAGALSGQSVTVSPGATLRRLPASGAGTAPDETGTLTVPLVNNGTVELDASLAASAGYTQLAAAHPPSGAAAPLTAVLAGSTLSAPSALSVSAGGIGGKGTLRAPSLSLAGAWIAPGYRAKCHEVDSTVAETCVGTLTVDGALKLSATSDVQVVVRSATDHDALVTTGAAALAGKMTVATGANYKPPAGLTVSKAIRYASRTGAFATIASPAAPVGFGWHLSYDDVAGTDGRGVDVHLVDIQAPVLGFAGIPAFTQQTVIEIVYAAVDNSSGVASYDVRWRRVGLTGGFSKWVYPKTWWHTKKKSQVITNVAEGYTYCASVRARDNAGNVTRWTPAPCSARMVDDRFLRAVAHWTRFSGRTRWYDKTFSRATARGATLWKYATFTRVAVTALHCPTCGVLQIYVGKTLLKTLNLKSSKYGRTNFVSPAAKLRTAHVYLKVASRHRIVQIDAVGLLH